jgi:hypothetical protein
MDARIAHLLHPGQEAIVELGEAGDAMCFGLEQKALADERIELFDLAPALRLSG